MALAVSPDRLNLRFCKRFASNIGYRGQGWQTVAHPEERSAIPVLTHPLRMSLIEWSCEQLVIEPVIPLDRGSAGERSHALVEVKAEADAVGVLHRCPEGVDTLSDDLSAAGSASEVPVSLCPDLRRVGGELPDDAPVEGSEVAVSEGLDVLPNVL